MHRASCIVLLSCIAGLTVAAMALAASPRTVAFVWDGEAFHRQPVPSVTIPAPRAVQQADLDGDGALEAVELQDGVLRLTDDGQIAWQSDPAWTGSRTPFCGRISCPVRPSRLSRRCPSTTRCTFSIPPARPASRSVSSTGRAALSFST